MENESDAMDREALSLMKRVVEAVERIADALECRLSVEVSGAIETETAEERRERE